MRGVSTRGAAPGALLLTGLLLLVSWQTLAGIDAPLEPPAVEPEPLSAASEPALSLGRAGAASRVDVPAWRLGDLWTYDTTVEVSGLLTLANISGASVGDLTGDLDAEIVGLRTESVDGTTTLVYERLTDGEVRTRNNGATFPLENNSVTGLLKLDIEMLEVLRASDLAAIRTEVTLVIRFCPFSLCFLSELELATLEITTNGTPPEETWDFPLEQGEQWSTSSVRRITWTGESDLADIPLNDTEQEANVSTVHRAVGRGATPGIGYAGCQDSLNVTSGVLANGTNGSANGSGNVNQSAAEAALANASTWRWWCPAVRGPSLSRATLTEGAVIEQRLETYAPNGSTGVNANSDPGQRSPQLLVTLEPPATPGNRTVGAWVNVSDGSGPVNGASGHLRHEVEGTLVGWTTAANGSAWVTFETGNTTDVSPGGSEHGSHGIVAWQIAERRTGAATLVLDESVVEFDLVAPAGAIGFERTRAGERVVLTGQAPTGYTAVPGDIIHVSIPVRNGGIRASPASSVEVSVADGTPFSVAVQPLAAGTTVRVEANWTVPAGEPLGAVNVTSRIDPQDLFIEGNESNNEDSASLLIGRLPSLVVAPYQAVLTEALLTLDANGSSDPDGGAVTCSWWVERGPHDPGPNVTIDDVGCVLVTNWTQDGTFLVRLTVSDDEGDAALLDLMVDVLNRVPTIVGLADQTVDVETEVTLDISDSYDADTLHPEAPFTSVWTGLGCLSQTTTTCTVRPVLEGPQTVSVTLTDDDGGQASQSVTITGLNVAPFGVGLTAVSGSTQLVADALGVYAVDEDEVIGFEAWAEDTASDRTSLTYEWALDADADDPRAFSGSEILDGVWTTSGLHTVTVQAVDDDGARSPLLTRWMRVSNVAPTLDVTGGGVVAEDDQVTLTVVVEDTPSDVAGLVTCVDLEPDTDADGIGGTDDDCDVVVRGGTAVVSYETSGVRTVVVWTMDDDGARASEAIVIDVRNRPPVAVATLDGDDLVDGDRYTLSAAGSSDTPSDTSGLTYAWDLDVTVDSDGDGDAANDADRTGVSVEVTASAGDRLVRLRVSDEATSDVDDVWVNVSEAPVGGVLGLLGADDGSPVIVGLGVVLLVLLGGIAIALRRKPDPGLLPPSAVGRPLPQPVDALWDAPEAGEVPPGTPPAVTNPGPVEPATTMPTPLDPAPMAAVPAMYEAPVAAPTAADFDVLLSPAPAPAAAPAAPADLPVATAVPITPTPTPAPAAPEASSTPAPAPAAAPPATDAFDLDL